MPVILDTSVLIEALRAAALGSAAGQDALAAAHVMEEADQVVVSAIALFELECGFTEEIRRVFARWNGVLRVDDVDAAIARRAAELLKESQGAPDICDRCFGVQPSAACLHCGGQATKQRKTNDALIVATAELRTDIAHLYSFDGGMLHYGQYAKRVIIERPPPAPSVNLELFSPTPVEQPNKPAAAKGKKK